MVDRIEIYHKDGTVVRFERINVIQWMLWAGGSVEDLRPRTQPEYRGEHVLMEVAKAVTEGIR